MTSLEPLRCRPKTVRAALRWTPRGLLLAAAAALLAAASNDAHAQRAFQDVAQCEGEVGRIRQEINLIHKAISRCMSGPPQIGRGENCGNDNRMHVTTRAWPQCSSIEAQQCDAQSRVEAVQTLCREMRREAAVEREAARRENEVARRAAEEQQRAAWRSWAESAIPAAASPEASAIVPQRLRQAAFVANGFLEAHSKASDLDTLGRLGWAMRHRGVPGLRDAVRQMPPTEIAGHFNTVIQRNPAYRTLNAFWLGQIEAQLGAIDAQLESAMRDFTAFSVGTEMQAKASQVFERATDTSAWLRELDRPSPLVAAAFPEVFREIEEMRRQAAAARAQENARIASARQREAAERERQSAELQRQAAEQRRQADEQQRRMAEAEAARVQAAQEARRRAETAASAAAEREAARAEADEARERRAAMNAAVEQLVGAIAGAAARRGGGTAPPSPSTYAPSGPNHRCNDFHHITGRPMCDRR